MFTTGNPHPTRLEASVLKRIGSSLRRLPAKMGATKNKAEPGFFDRYPRFYTTSTVGTDKGERLNERYRALIRSNIEIIREKTVLDLASHDGRWSFAALEAGARHVTGIEVRSYLVEHAIASCREYGAGDRCRFIAGDVFDQIEHVQTDSIDTVFCFGFFYHTPHHMLLLSKIDRLNAKYLVLDTEIDPSTTDCIVRFRKEKIVREANSLVGQPGDPSHAFVGKPSRSALETMLTSFGWTFSYYDWHRAGIKNWHGIRAYRDGWRVSLVATRSST
ncbi:MAG: class I SAM-dependent methyltransferase [Candidatus Binatus sp.]|uniref:class I SAM-dependent methyltransferase n=2 Tax=Candidatus Binatus sp. TaxID=2811406 RepID=UPI003C4E5E76